MSQQLVSQEQTVREELQRVGLSVVEGLLVNRRSGHRQKHRRLIVQNNLKIACDVHLVSEKLQLIDPSPVKHRGY